MCACIHICIASQYEGTILSVREDKFPSAQFLYCSLIIYKLFQVIEQSGVLEAPGLKYNNIPAVVTTAVGQMVKFLYLF